MRDHGGIGMQYIEGIIFTLLIGLTIGSCIVIRERNTASDCVRVCGQGNIENCGFYSITCK